MYEQLNMFDQMNGRRPPIDVVCDHIRSAYEDYLEDMKHTEPEEDEGPRILPFREFFKGMLSSWTGWEGTDEIYWSINLSPTGARILERFKKEPILISKYEIMRRLGL